MATKAKKMTTKVRHLFSVYTPEEKLRIWRKARGILKGKGPKDPVAWQRRIRKDRKIVL